MEFAVQPAVGACLEGSMHLRAARLLHVRLTSVLSATSPVLPSPSASFISSPRLVSDSEDDGTDVVRSSSAAGAGPIAESSAISDCPFDYLLSPPCTVHEQCPNFVKVCEHGPQIPAARIFHSIVL